jgi:hypothetical protein
VQASRRSKKEMKNFLANFISIWQQAQKNPQRFIILKTSVQRLIIKFRNFQSVLQTFAATFFQFRLMEKEGDYDNFSFFALAAYVTRCVYVCVRCSESTLCRV